MKKAFALLLALALLLSLAGCQENVSGESASTPNDAHTHSYTETVTAPTCIERGYTTYACACGNTYKANEVAALGHSYADAVCQRCGHKNIPSQGLLYELMGDNSSYCVVGVGSCTDSDIVIPAEYEGLPVTDIGDSAFEDCTMITSVSLPDGLEYIGYAAFSGCGALKTVMISNSVSRIGRWAFQSCIELTSITLPDNMLEISDSLFSGCVKLERVSVSNQLTSIESQAFYGCESLRDFTVPSSVTFMGELAFSGCVNLLQEADGVTYVGKWILSCDPSVTEVTLRDDTLGIAASAFTGCSNLTDISIPDTVIGIGDYAFYECTNLKSIKLPGIKYIESSMFSGCSNLTEVIFSDGVVEIHPNVFNNCSSLTHITLPGGIARLECALYKLPKLNRIDFGGTKEEWISLLKKSHTSVKCTVYCTDGEIQNSQ